MCKGGSGNPKSKFQTARNPKSNFQTDQNPKSKFLKVKSKIQFQYPKSRFQRPENPKSKFPRVPKSQIQISNDKKSQIRNCLPPPIYVDVEKFLCFFFFVHVAGKNKQGIKISMSSPFLNSLTIVTVDTKSIILDSRSWVDSPYMSPPKSELKKEWNVRFFSRQPTGIKISMSSPFLRDRSLFMTGGARRKTEFSGKIFHGPLSAQLKNFAAHSTLPDNFSTPTLEEYNRSIFIGKICASCTCWKVISMVLKTHKKCRGSGENFLGRNILTPTLAFSIFFPSPLSVHQKFFVAPPLFPPGPPRP